MNLTASLPAPTLDALPKNLPMDGSIGIDFADGFPVLCASVSVQRRIEELLDIQRQAELSASQNAELNAYAEMDDYLSFLNRVIRNLQEASFRMTCGTVCKP